MKRNTHGKSILTAALTGFLLAAAVAAWAQPDNGARPLRRPAPPGEGERPMVPGGGFGQFGPGLGRLLGVLTDDQRASLRQAMEELRPEAGDLDQKLRTARQEVFAASVADNFDVEVVQQKAAALAKLEAVLTVLRAKALSRMCPRLTPEQLEKIKNPGPSETGDGQPPAPRRRRPEAPRDENGLPPKDPSVPPQPKPL